jgi:periplasmic protein TonB
LDQSPLSSTKVIEPKRAAEAPLRVIAVPDNDLGSTPFPQPRMQLNLAVLPQVQAQSIGVPFDGYQAPAKARGAGGDGLSSGAPATLSGNKPPRYPAEARRRGYEGTVLLNIQVLAGGAVGEVTIARSSGYDMLDDAAVEAVKQWRFAPAKVGGQAVEANVTLPVQFVLRA